MSINIPEEFDCRVHWDIAKPLNQHSCDACWAFSTCLTLSDRLKIANPNSDFARRGLVLSPEYMVQNNLCKTGKTHVFGDTSFCRMGCSGGFIDTGIKYLMLHGAPSSSSSSTGSTNTTNKLYKAKSYYKLPPDVTAIKKDIMVNGPVVAGFSMHQNCWNEEFNNYYDRVEGKKLFNHACSIVAWKKHQGRSWWVVRNSYGQDYMDGGYLYLPLGINFCNIESDVYGIIPTKI
jgi:cathepsin L